MAITKDGIYCQNLKTEGEVIKALGSGAVLEFDANDCDLTDSMGDNGWVSLDKLTSAWKSLIPLVNTHTHCKLRALYVNGVGELL